jgi:hypothetical protein
MINQRRRRDLRLVFMPRAYARAGGTRDRAPAAAAEVEPFPDAPSALGGETKGHVVV